MPKKATTAKTGAERQKAYRERRKENLDKDRLDVFIEFHAKKRLERIARHRDCTVSALIEAWTKKEEDKIISKFTPAEEREYFR